MSELARRLSALLPPGSTCEVEYEKRGRLKSKLVLRIDGARHVFQFFRQRRIARRFASLLELLARHGIPAQRVVRSGETGGRQRHVVETTYLEGHFLDPAQPRDLESFARTLARLHAIGSPAWGRLVRNLPLLRAGYRAKIMMNALTGAWALWRAGVPARLLRDVLRWLWPQTAVLRRPQRFHLIHGDLHIRNILVNESAVGLIDYEAMAFEHAGFEVASCILKNFAATSAHWQRFWDAYRAAAGAEMTDMLDRSAALWLTVAMLRWSRTRLRRVPDAAGRTRRARFYADILARLRAALPEGGGPMDVAMGAVHAARQAAAT